MNSFRVEPRHAHLIDPAEKVAVNWPRWRRVTDSYAEPKSEDREPDGRYTAQPPPDTEHLPMTEGAYRATPRFF